MPKQLHIYVYGDERGDDEWRAGRAASLRSELRAHDVEAHHPAVPAPPGAMGSALEWGQLVVAFMGTLPVVVGAVRQWLGRQESTKITVSIDGDEITIDDPSDAEQAQLLEAWTDRHARD